MKRMLKSLVLVILFAGLSISNLMGVIAANDIYCSFNDVPEKGQIEENVVQGCTNFLKSKAAFYMLLVEYEKSCNQPADIQKMNEYLEETIASLEVSVDFYIRARDIGQRIGLNPQKLDWFRTYNYNMLVANQHLKPDMSMKVRQYLSKGDILGVYNQNIFNINDLLVELTGMRLKLAKKIKPDVTAMWRILEKYTDTLLFGTYSTRIGKAVLNNCETDLSEEIQ